ncbi:MAG: phenylalanine--tRNA ligase subunit beta [Clostridia bacterium]
MYISINWIKDFVNLDGIDIDSLIYNFTMSTAEVEGSVKYGYNTVGVVVGQILEIETVKEKENLSKVKVNLGEQIVETVCGAKNIFVGAKVPFAKNGAKLQGKTVSPYVIGDITSNGICLSQKELGMGADHSGVMILEDFANIGQDIKEIIPLEDTVFEIDNKSITNRPDLWGHYGIAREIAAITKRKLKPLQIEDLSIYDKLPKLDICVDNKKQCFRYTGITIENINKKVSTYEMKTRLYYTGFRSINLLADITNYVMLELGQPMHAFDKRFVEKINVSSLEEQKCFVTLDNVTRKLPVGTLMINNQNGPIAIAGIMGGQNSEIKEDTTSLFLESATFDSTLIRKSASKIGHRTDASTRYEKTLDPKLAKLATQRYIYLLKKEDKAIKITSAFTDIYLYHYKKVEIEIDKDFFDKYIGISIPMDTIVQTLTYLEFKVVRNKENLKVSVPSFRATKDVSLKADLIEEVSRIYGYDNIEAKSNLWNISPVEQDEIHILEYEVKRLLAEKYGASEVHSYVWYNEEKNRELEIEVEDNLKIVNGLNKADSTLRATMGASMLYAINTNLKYMQECSIFEIGRVFKYSFDNKTQEESKVLSVGLASTKETEEKLMLQAKSMIEAILKTQKNIKAVYEQNTQLKYKWIHKTNSYVIKLNDKVQGHISLVHPKVKNNIKKQANIVIAELRIDNLKEISSRKIIYAPITKYQTVNIDLTLTMDKKIKFEQIEKLIKNINLEYLMEYNLVDIYENEEKLPGKKSVTIKFVIGSHRKTLLKEEIDNHMNTLIDTFNKNHFNINI